MSHADLTQIGREILGPAFCLHAHRTILVARQRRLERLLFLARDGWLLQRLHERLAPVLACTTPQQYLRVSRRSTALAAVRRFGPRELRLAGRDVHPTLWAVLRSYDLVDRQLLDEVSAQGIDPTAPVAALMAGSEMQRLCDAPRFVALVSERAAAARERLRRHLADEGLRAGERLGLVDVGWSGSIQDNLERAFAGDGQPPYFYGLYFGLYRWPSGDGPGEGGRREGTVYDGRRSASLRESAPLQLVQIFEQAGRPDEGTVVDYRDEGGRMVAVLRGEGPQREVEHATWPAVQALQAGVLAAADDYAAQLRRAMPNVDELIVAAQRRLERLIYLPTEREVAAVAQLVHVEDWGESSTRALVGGEPISWRPRRWLQQFQHARWKPAYLRRTAGEPLCRLFHAYEAFKRRRLA